MTTNDGWKRIAAYFQQQLNESMLQPTTFAKRWGTNEKTLRRILDGTPVRGDAQAKIAAARGWPADAFDRLGRGEAPEAEAGAELVRALAGRVEVIERHLGLAPGVPVEAAIEADSAMTALQKRQLLAAYRAAVESDSP